MENINKKFIVEEDSLDLKEVVGRYLRYWIWFILGLITFLVLAYVYMRYASPIYQTAAKIKILDESEGLELPTSAFIFKRSNINLENETEILKSYRILEKVVLDKKLNTLFYVEGNIRTAKLDRLPFYFEQKVKPEVINTSKSYTIVLNDTNFEVTDLDTEKTTDILNHNSYLLEHSLPFEIKLYDSVPLELIEQRKYIVAFQPARKTVLNLKNSLSVEPIGEQSDLLKLSLKDENSKWAETIIDAIIEAFDQDGITDRQLVSKRTLDFIDDRFEFLAFELDSIEKDRKEFKQENNLVDLIVDSEIGLEQRTRSNEEVFRLENQLALAQLLEESLKEKRELELLPANIGLENNTINNLINDYNKSILERDKLLTTGGINNPQVKLTEGAIRDLRNNINNSLRNYINQLQLSKTQLQNRNRQFIGQVSQIPEKEKLLRAIERQQKIKESLYLLLLQKREEAAINLAITEPSIKVVEYALTGSLPVSPKRSFVYAGAILLGLLMPFGILYVMFMLDTKIHSKEDVTEISSNIPVIGEIPDLKKKQDLIFTDPNDRSALAESFRILSSNVDYILPVTENQKSKVIYCTSTIKGEGKTLVSLNLSLALSSINKKVLLIGADLRNPQIHNYINEDKHKQGLSNYLHDIDFSWKEAIIKGFDKHPNHNIILSGSIPPNPAHLLTNGRFKALIEEAKKDYDYIIVDTAPTILVTDTMLISQLADATVYIVRADYTEKNLLNYSKELSASGRIKNMAYVINSVGASKSYGYGYNYGYNYGYGNKA